MGQTLTNGIYLPAKGERNCYDGLEGNWRSLDGLISTVGGKASASHTHGNITNDGKLANGNKVVITNANKVITESSVTDTELGYLSGVTSAIQTQLNAKATDSGVVHTTGNETVGGVKTFSSLIKQSAAFSGDYTDVYQLVDSNNYRIVSLRASKGTASNTLGIYVHDQNNSAPKGLIVGNDLSNNITIVGSGTNNYLGISTNRWSAVYSDSYYYGTTAWGLDKKNNWTGANTFKASVTYEGNFACYWKRANLTVGTLPSTTIYYGVTRYADSAGTTITLNRGLVDTSGKNYFRQYTYAFNDTSKYCSMGSGINADGSGSYFAFGAESVIPSNNTISDLGTSTNKWKTLNGVNPGALSLPDFSADFDVSGQIVPPTGENQISINWGRNTFTPSVNGWLSVRIHKATSIEIYRSIRSSYCVASRIESADDICVCSPVVAGVEYTIKIQATQVSPDYDHFRLSPCQGNI